MRYFLIPVVTPYGHSQIVDEFDSFPSGYELRRTVSQSREDCMPAEVVILNIYEFKSEQDYKDFIK